MKNYIIIALTVICSIAIGDCPDADLNGDCKVTIEDFAIVASEWMAEGIYSDFVYPTESQVTDARTMHLKLKGRNTGEIIGSCVDGELEDSIAIIDYQHDISVPYNPSTGVPNEQPVHGLLTVKKFIDKSSPQLLQALFMNDEISDFDLSFYRRNSDDSIEQYYTINLKNAYIVDYKTEGPNIESFSFSYKRITWTYDNTVQCEANRVN